MVEVFKTDVDKEEEAEAIVRELSEYYPEHRINFDLEDCDKILRVEGRALQPRNIITYMNKLSYQCSVLE